MSSDVPAFQAFLESIVSPLSVLDFTYIMQYVL